MFHDTFVQQIREGCLLLKKRWTLSGVTKPVAWGLGVNLRCGNDDHFLDGALVLVRLHGTSMNRHHYAQSTTENML